MRFALIAHFMLAGWAALAQPDLSLTPEFAGMSAKERARVAKLEQEDAVKDAIFQTAMAEAEALFQQLRFDEALAKYQHARSLRPLNVFPKVKIQDLQALIAKRAAEAAMKTQPEPHQEAPELKIEAVSESSPDSQRTAPGQVRSSAVVNGTDPVRPGQPRIKDQAPPMREPAPQSADHVPDGMQERTFFEGRAVVLERRVVRDGAHAVYRKVTHPWGQVMHFRDGIAISDRAWAEAFRD